jgi:hypothetical protein
MLVQELFYPADCACGIVRHTFSASQFLHYTLRLGPLTHITKAALPPAATASYITTCPDPSAAARAYSVSPHMGTQRQRYSPSLRHSLYQISELPHPSL